MEPIADSEIKRVLVVTAHPDDSDFGASGTLAKWIKAGIHVSYCICTNGDQGGEESGIPVEEMPAVRQREQRTAGEAIGVTDITFLNYRDGSLEPTLGLRKDIVKAIQLLNLIEWLFKARREIGSESEPVTLITLQQVKVRFKRFIQMHVTLLHFQIYLKQDLSHGELKNFG
jgi:LmbE family N-acetylglucosaminyl deacetylase